MVVSCYIKLDYRITYSHNHTNINPILPFQSHILNCPDREIVKYLSYEPDFERESPPPEQGLIESTENWDDDYVVDYDPNIQVEKFKKIAEAADKEGYIAPVELPTGPVVNIITSQIDQIIEKPIEKVEINGQVIKIKREKTYNEEVNENETMALLDEELKEPETIIVLPPLVDPPKILAVPPRRLPEIRVKKEWSPIPPRRRSPSPRRRTPVRRYTPSPRRSLSTRRRSPSPRRRTPVRRYSPSPRRAISPRRRSPSPRRRSPSLRRRSPSPRRRSPGYYKMVSPPPRIKREPDDNGYIHSRDRFDTSRRYDRSPPPAYRVKDEFNGRSSRHDPYLKYEEEQFRKSKFDDYYRAKPDYYEEKSKSSKDLYSKYEEYEKKPRYEERRRSPSPKVYPAAYRPRSRSPVNVRYERARSRSPPPRPKYIKERSPRYEKERSPRYERRKTPPLAPPKSSKDYYDLPPYGIDKEKSFRKNSDRRIKTEKSYSPPRAYKLRESRKSPDIDDEDMVYTRHA